MLPITHLAALKRAAPAGKVVVTVEHEQDTQEGKIMTRNPRTDSLSRRLCLALIVLPLALMTGGTPDTSGFRYYLATKRDAFIPVIWMLNESRGFSALSPPVRHVGVDQREVEKVNTYFSLINQSEEKQRQFDRLFAANNDTDPGLGALREDMAALDADLTSHEKEIESIIEGQVAWALGEAGVTVSLGSASFIFPPVNFRFVRLPNLLVVSPRDRITRESTITLRADLAPEGMEQVEDQIASLNMAGLVTPIGGLGLYPSMIPRSYSREYVIRTVAHEWTHQYLFLRPLGWRYGLGIEPSGDAIAVNETVAGIVGYEIGNRVLEHFYGAKPPAPEPAGSVQTESPPDAFNFNLRMRQIRVKVEDLLGDGRITEAESHMEDERQFLLSRGYPIRKLNQAYFAFYGSYADGPGGISPVYGHVQQLRDEHTDLAGFLHAVSGVSTYEEMKQQLSRIQVHSARGQ